MPSPIRLLWLLDSLGMGGAEALAIPFARKVDRGRYELIVASMSEREVNAAEAGIRDAGVRVVHLGARHLRDREAFGRLRALVSDERIEFVHAHLTYSAIWSARLSRSTGIPSAASLHVAPEVTRQAEKTLRGRLSSDARDRVMRLALNRWSSGVIMVSEALRQSYESPPRLRREKVHVVHNGIDVERFRRDRAETRAHLQREFAIPPGAPLAVSVAVLRKGKGIETLIDAAAMVEGVHFLVAGDGPLAAELRMRADERRVNSRIHWAGFRTDVESILAGCDLFVHPTLADAFPTVLLEAMAAGLPLIASDVGGVPEIVEEGVTGTLVPPGNAETLAAAIRELLSDPDSLKRMSAAAQRIAAERFSTEAWLARLDAVYRQVLGDRAAAP